MYSVSERTQGLPMTEVNIVGAGPVGLLTALLLGRAGLTVALYERWPASFSRPRACGLDHEGARILQSARLMSGIEHIFEPVMGDRTYEFQNAAGERLLEIQWNKPGLCGWPQMSTFNQPQLEAALERHLSLLPNVEIMRGAEFLGLDQDEAGVTLRLRTSAGEAFARSSRYLVAADGANSVVRDSLGITQTDLGFQYDWLVVDVVPHQPREWKPHVVQRCDPARPATAVGSGPGRRRFEFMRLPGESLDELNRPETAWRLMRSWGLTPENASLERSAVYTFRGRWADAWRLGRVMLAGDAAHLMPPFLAQGLCSGLRDARALAWRLPAALAGHDWVLESYGPERLQHCQELIEQAVELGRRICILDPTEAEARDSAMLEALKQDKGAVRPPPQPRLGHGLLAAGNEQAGLLFPQGRISLEGRNHLFDDVFQPGWQLVIRAGLDGRMADAGALTRAASHGLRVIDLSHMGIAGDDDDIYQRWFDEAGVDVAIVRPDFYIFGASRLDGLDGLLRQFIDRCGTAFLPTSPRKDQTGAVTEICKLRVRDGEGPAFEEGFRRSEPVLDAMPGHLRHRLRRQSEQPGAYVLEVDWCDLAGHLVDFRQSAQFGAFTREFASFLSAPTEVFHLQD